MRNSNRRKVLMSLLSISKRKGHITCDTLLSYAGEYSLSLSDLNWVYNEAIDRNIINYDTEIRLYKTDEEYRYLSKYENVYSEIIRICPSVYIFVDQVKRIKPPQFKEIYLLKTLLRLGNEHARKRMIEIHLGLALKIALHSSKKYDLDLEETIGLACEGLIIAVDKYEPDKNDGRFANYVKQFLLNTIESEPLYHNTLIQYSDKCNKQYRKVYRLIKERGCLNCELYETCSDAREMISIQLNCKPDQVNSIISMSMPMISLDSLLDNGIIDLNRIQSICSDNSTILGDDIFEIVNRKLISNDFMSKIAYLPLKQMIVLRLRYGLLDGNPKSLEEVGRILDLSRERIRQIEKKALENLKEDIRLRGKNIPDNIENIANSKEENKQPAAASYHETTNTLEQELSHRNHNITLIPLTDDEAKKINIMSFETWLSTRINDSSTIKRIIISFVTAEKYSHNCGLYSIRLFGVKSLSEAKKSITSVLDNKDFANRHIRAKEVLGTFGKEYYLRYVFEMISSIQKGNKRIVDQRRGHPAEREQRKKDKRPDGSIRHNQTDSSPTGLSHSSISMEFVFSEFDHSEDDLLLKDISGLGLAYDDDRANGGCLWVYGDTDIEEKIYRLEKKHLVLFHLKKIPDKKSRRKGWWTKDVSRFEQ